MEGIGKGYLFCLKWYNKVVRVDHGAEPPRIKLCWVPTPKEENTLTPPMCSRVLEISPGAWYSHCTLALACGRQNQTSLSGNEREETSAVRRLLWPTSKLSGSLFPKSLSRCHVVSSIYVVKFTFLNWILSLVLPICPAATDFCESEVCSCLQILPVSILCVYYYFYKKKSPFLCPPRKKETTLNRIKCQFRHPTSF